jgi:hypothetical protein
MIYFLEFSIISLIPLTIVSRYSMAYALFTASSVCGGGLEDLAWWRRVFDDALSLLPSVRGESLSSLMEFIFV